MTFEELPSDGMVEVGKKKMLWYDVYKFTEEQELLWKTWATNKLKDSLLDQKLMHHAEFAYGFVRKYKKEGEL